MLSIVTPILNGEDFIESNIKSILQLEIPFEHIIVDGGSKDKTLDIIEKYDHIKLVHQTENTGMYGAIHMGFEHAKGDYFAYINCDDLLIKEGFEAMYELITSSKENDFVYSNAIFNFQEESRESNMISKKNAKFFLKKGIMPFVQPSSIYSKDLYTKVGGLRFDKFRLCGDLDLFQRMVLSGVTPNRVNAFSTKFLMYSGSLAATNREKMKKELSLLEKPTSTNEFFNKVLFKLIK